MTELRPVRAGDLDDVVALEARVFADAAWSPRSIEAEFDLVGEARSIWVAEDRGQVSGYAVLMYSGETADIPRVVVAEGSRRQGVATALVSALVERARALSCTQVLLEVAEDNGPATALYESLGFTPIDRRPRYYADGSTAVVMRRPTGVGERA